MVAERAVGFGVDQDLSNSALARGRGRFLTLPLLHRLALDPFDIDLADSHNAFHDWHRFSKSLSEA